MNQNISKLLSAAMVVGLLAGTSAIATEKAPAKKAAAPAKKAAGKNACKGHSKDGHKKDACSGKDGCQAEHKDGAGAAPAPEGEAHPE